MTRIHLSVNIIIKTLVLQLVAVGKRVVLSVLEPVNGTLLVVCSGAGHPLIQR